MTDATDMHHYPVYKETGGFDRPGHVDQRDNPMKNTVIAVVASPLPLSAQGLEVIVAATDADGETFKRTKHWTFQDVPRSGTDPRARIVWEAPADAGSGAELDRKPS